MTMHGFKLGGSGIVFFLPWKMSQKQISQEEYNRKKEKLNITFSPKNAVKMALERKKKVIYHLPNGAYVVMK